MQQDLERCSCGPALEDRAGHAYNEAAFRHFLSIERKRARRSGHSFCLLLVTLKTRTDNGVSIAPGLSAKLFSALRGSVREVDFVGWYRNKRVVGAVLTQGVQPISKDAPALIAARVTQALCQELPSDVFERLQVRIAQLPRRSAC